MAKRWVTYDEDGNEHDGRLGRIWHIVDTKGKSLGDWLLLRKIGPGHFIGQQGEREMEVYSPQLRGIVDDN